MSRIRRWLDERIRPDRPMAGGASVPAGVRIGPLDSLIVFLFAVLFLTGVLLMSVYSPSTATAWASTWYIQSQMSAGWLIRGIHHFATDALILVLPIRLIQMVLTRAYRSPREFDWWIVLALLGLVVGTALTGCLLPWDQHGYWGTKVRTGILSLAPVVGRPMARWLVGGVAPGNLMLTRFFTLHVALLPGLTIAVLVAQRVLHVRRARGSAAAAVGGTAQIESRPAPGLANALARLCVLITILGAAWYVHSVRGDALLDSPANPESANYPARPEWYFLFLHQLLKYFQRPGIEVIGAVLIPGLAALLVFAIPLYDYVLSPKAARGAAIVLVLGLLSGASWLTWEGVRDDLDPPNARVAEIEARQRAGAALSQGDQAALRARAFHRQREEADRVARRAMQLADEGGVPPAGPLEMMRGDPLLQGPRLFAENCASCHRWHGHNGRGEVPSEPATASDLSGFGTGGWVSGLLEDPSAERYFGRVKREDGSPGHTKMAKFLKETREDNSSEEDRKDLRDNFAAVAAYLADEAAAPGRLADKKDKEWSKIAEGSPIERGRAFFLDVCNECHTYQGEQSGTMSAPEMFGYGSTAWIEKMIANPADDSLYRSKGRESALMPSFADRLSEQDRRLLARWIHDSSGPPAKPVRPGS